MAKLGEICTVVSGSTPKTSVASYWDGSIKWITPAELNNESFYITDSVRHITEEGKEKTGLLCFPAGTVILSSRAPIGKTAIAGCEMCCNQGFKNLICSEKIYNEYLYFFLKSKTDYLNSLGRGATFKEISKTIVENIEVPLPDINQQKGIAEKFKKLEELISLRKQQLAKLDELVKARFVEMFGEPRSNPCGFDKKPLKSTCKVITGNTPSRSESENYGDFIEWIKTDNIIAGLLNPTSAVEKLSEEGAKRGKIVHKGAILMACIAGSVASIGRVCVTDRTVAFNQQINAIVSEKYNIIFLYVLLQMSKDYLVEDVNLSLKGILSKSKLEDKEFIIPPLSLQNEFSAFVECVDHRKQTVQQSLEKLELMKKALMQEYFG